MSEPHYQVQVRQFGRFKRYWVVLVSPDGTAAKRPMSAVDDPDQAQALADRFNARLAGE